MEAALIQVPAISMSQRDGRDDLPIMGQVRVLASPLSDIFWMSAFLAGNHEREFPKTSVDQVKGIKPAFLDRHKLCDIIVAGHVPHHYRLGPLHSDPQKLPGSDRAVLDDGWISLTPLMMDVTAQDVIASLTPTRLDIEPVR